jgi:hypothetical protein
MSEQILFFGIFAWGVLGWVMYFREHGRSRDYATDLAQVIYDHDLGREDLRRSLGYDEIEDRL